MSEEAKTEQAASWQPDITRDKLVLTLAASIPTGCMGDNSFLMQPNAWAKPILEKVPVETPPTDSAVRHPTYRLISENLVGTVDELVELFRRELTAVWCAVTEATRDVSSLKAHQDWLASLSLCGDPRTDGFKVTLRGDEPWLVTRRKAAREELVQRLEHQEDSRSAEERLRETEYLEKNPQESVYSRWALVSVWVSELIKRYRFVKGLDETAPIDGADFEKFCRVRCSYCENLGLPLPPSY